MTSACMIVCHFEDLHLPFALASLKQQTEKPHVILVDDASESQFRKAYAHVRDIEIIELSKNEGIGHARNVGLKYALRLGCDFIGFLDSDGIAHPRFVEEAVGWLNSNTGVLGVCAKKGLANPYSRVARMKYRYKTYKKDEFQLDCSLFRREAFERRVPERRVGEDSVFILSFTPGKLAKLGIPYYHFECESFVDFFRDEYVGAYHSYKAGHKRVFSQILLTAFTSAKMIFMNRWFMEGLLFPFRQFVWLIGYLNGSRLTL